jgi:hypothetical protein
VPGAAAELINLRDCRIRLPMDALPRNTATTPARVVQTINEAQAILLLNKLRSSSSKQFSG